MRATALFNHVGRLNLIGRPNLIGRHVSLKKKILTKGKITCKFPLMLHAACKYLILFNKKKKFYRHCMHCFLCCEDNQKLKWSENKESNDEQPE